MLALIFAQYSTKQELKQTCPLPRMLDRKRGSALSNGQSGQPGRRGGAWGWGTPRQAPAAPVQSTVGSAQGRRARRLACCLK